jgi:hypothetical protein
MARIVNLTYSHVNIYGLGAFIGLRRIDETNWTALGTELRPIVSLPSEGILTIEERTGLADPCIVEDEGDSVVIPAYRITYLGIRGMPDDIDQDDFLIVPREIKTKAIKAGYPMASQMVCLTQAVQDLAGSIIGYMGLEL